MIYTSGFDYEIVREDTGTWVIGLRSNESRSFKTLDELLVFIDGLTTATRFRQSTGMEVNISTTGNLTRYLKAEEAKLRK